MNKIIRNYSSALVAAFALGACSQPLTSSGGAPAQAERAIDAEHLKRIDEVLQAEVDQNIRAGFVAAVVTRDGIAYQTAVGDADPFNDVPMSLDTRFRVASMTKPVISAAVMQLVDRGVINLNDPAGDYVAGYQNARVATSYDKNDAGEYDTRPAARAITIHDLLTHMAGIGYVFSAASDLERDYIAANLFMTEGTLCERIDQIAALPLLDDPGVKWNYSFSIDVLGCIIEAATGMSVEAYLTENMFKPLGMNSTEFFMDKEDLNGLAIVVEFNEQGEMIRSGAEALGTRVNDMPFGVMSGGAGLLSTVHDYSRFMQMLLSGGEVDGARILSPATVRLMMEDHTPMAARPEPWKNSGITFGLGGAVVLKPGYGREVAAKGDWGWAGYWDTWFSVNPDLNVGYITLAQAQPNPYIKPSKARFGVKAIAYGAVRN